jgi:hypothetical protein
MLRRRHLLAVLALLALPAGGLMGQVAPPAYTPLVWDENWSYLSDSSLALDWSDQWQHVSLGANRYISIGGQIRERGEYVDYPAWGAQPSHNGYFLQRYLLDTDWRLSREFWLFLQCGSSLENGRRGGPRPGIDQDALYFNQIFFDYSPSEGMTVRIGRQLISLGSTRLFAIGYGLNIEQPFDGARVMLHPAGWKIDLLAARPTQILDGYFQNGPNSQISTWGVYVTHTVAAAQKINLDLYYIGFDRKSWHYAAGAGRERRESFGARLWRDAPVWSWDLEVTPQTGRFGSGSIRAWAAGYHLVWRFAHARWTPVIEMGGGITSGDHNLHDSTLGTFNPLFPNGSYLSESLLIGPYNLDIVRPKLQMNLTRKLSFAPNLELLWRESRQDGIYNIAGVLTHPGTVSGRRYVGSQIQAGLNYSFSRHLLGSVVYEHFFPGAFLKQTPPNQGMNFVAPTLTYTF